jgi:predicted GH43/DUF377 family glycosyl hydrolase
VDPSSFPEWTLGPFIRPPDGNPVLSPNPASTFECPIQRAPCNWEALNVFNPAAIVKDDNVYLLYRAEDDSGQMKIGGHASRLGLAKSEDGIHFTSRPEPVLYPAEDAQKKREWKGGIEDPRIVELDGTFILTYTQKANLLSRLGIATSQDLEHWTKLGTVFEGLLYMWYTKSASIVCDIVDGRLQAVKINGYYWMYWGVKTLHLAKSEDCIHWTNCGRLIHPRPGYFDSILNEAGPPALLTEHGIILMYNGKNSPEHGDTTLTPNLYTCGQLLFDKTNPAKCLGRLDHPFFRPELPFEVTGQYVAGTTFIEGLVYFQEKWFLYYGCADSYVGVAIWDPAA